jgi:hypothetical protein
VRGRLNRQQPNPLLEINSKNKPPTTTTINFNADGFTLPPNNLPIKDPAIIITAADFTRQESR